MSRLTFGPASIFLVGIAGLALCPTSTSAEEIWLTPPEDALPPIHRIVIIRAVVPTLLPASGHVAIPGVPGLLDSLVQSAGADLFVEPVLVLTIAMVEHGIAKWDDMRVVLREATFGQKLELFGSTQKGIPALSLRALLRNRPGAILEDRRVGLRMLGEPHGELYEGVPITDWLGDPDLNWSAVERAVQPLLARARGDSP